jgi:signal transduction histidine kinase
MTGSVLIIEDEDDMRAMIQEVLAQDRYELAAAASGMEALRVLGETEYDVIVTDVRMPGIDGIGLLRVVKQSWPGTEVVVTTGHASLETAIAALHMGAFDFVRKPFHVDELRATVARAVEHKTLHTLATLHGASQAILAAPDPQKLPEMIVQVTREVLGADDVSLMVPEADGQLHVLYAHGLSPEVQAKTRVALGERVAGRVAVSREPALIVDGLSDDPRFADVVSQSEVRSSIVYPLVAGDRLVGVLNVSRVQCERPFQRQDVERAGVLASQILLAMENARLLRQAVTFERLAAVGQLAAGVAHEINNPVAYILATLGFLREEIPRVRHLGDLLEGGGDVPALRSCWAGLGGKAFVEEIGQALGDAEEGATRIRDIARDLRSLARGEEEQRSRVDLNEVVRAALRITNAELHHRAKVVTRLGADAWILGNAGRLSQVLVNLLMNAAQAFGDHSGRENEVLVTTRRDGRRVVAEVADNGPGIEPTHLRRIFEAFFTTKADSGGSGLGLAICQDIVRRHGGEIRAESELGRGARFTLDLPFAPGGLSEANERGRAARQEAEKAPAPERRPRRRVLFVDDEPAMLKAYTRAFSDTYEVVMAAGGEEALAILSSRRDFDAVVCDLLMPGVNGMEVHRRVSELAPELAGAFVFVTGGVTQGDIRSFLQGVGDRVLAKPFEFSALREMVEAR